ncbi:ribose 5-phosphate isomerase B [Rickettsiales bacterium]|nr:ribose 5-phosphate isomerase B [Rickettsiales bacterium]
MNILIASDHAGFELKSHLITEFSSDHEFNDLGCEDNISVDYPDIAKNLCQKFLSNVPKYDFGILICGTGIGVSIVANRFADIRAALCQNAKMAQLSRNHNNANILCLGARMIDKEEAINCFKSFISSDFKAGRHLSRINKI